MSTHDPNESQREEPPTPASWTLKPTEKLSLVDKLNALPNGAVIRTSGVVYVKDTKSRNAHPDFQWVAALRSPMHTHSARWLGDTDGDIVVLYPGSYA